MERISGVSNWRLVIRREAAGIVILHAVTSDTRAALPEELFGLPVIALGPRALGVGRAVPAGESVEITCGRGDGEWTNANLCELTLPESLRRVGDYAFLNCARLKKLSLGDGIAFWGGSCFMNCRLLNTFEITRTGAQQGESLAYIADELSCELDVTIRMAGGEVARLIFPEYVELFEENVPNHNFNYTICGAGYPYHRCFKNKKLQLIDYDLLWPRFLSVEYDEDTAVRMAVLRLRYPAELTEPCAEGYRKYLSAHSDLALRRMLEERDGGGVAFLLRQIQPDREVLSAACDFARTLGAAEALAVLMEEQHRRFPAAKSKTFDL